MLKRTLHKDILLSFHHSIGRFLSIMFLMLLGSFALVGLKVVKPNVDQAMTELFTTHNTMDLAVIGDYGISESDQQELSTLFPTATIEYGYFTDVVIDHTNTSFRLFSLPKDISQFTLITGKMPATETEVALDNFYRTQYQIGDTINFSQNGNTNQLLASTQYTVTGFVTSPDILSETSRGTSTSGTGTLEGFGVISPKAFDSKTYTIARFRYNDLSNMNTFSKKYWTKLEEFQHQLEKSLLNNGSLRLSSIQTEAQNEIHSAEEEISQAESKLSSGESAVSSAESELSLQRSNLDSANADVSSNDETLANALSELTTAETTLTNSKQMLDNAFVQIQAAETTLSSQKNQLDEATSSLTVAKTQLDETKNTLDTTKTELDTHKTELDNKSIELSNAKETIDANQTALNQAKSELAIEMNAISEQGIDIHSSPEIIAKQTMIAELSSALETAIAEYTTGLNAYNLGLTEYETGLTEYNEGVTQYETALAEYEAKSQEFNSGLTAYEEGMAILSAKKTGYQSGLIEYNNGLAEYNVGLNNYHSGKKQLEEAQQQLKDGESQYNDGNIEFQKKKTEFQNQKTDAETEIATAKVKIDNAKSDINKLETPEYHIYTRRTMLGADGYRILVNSVDGIHSIGNLFPVVLFLVAALVTMTTMTRFVNEERKNAGILKALGYDNSDVIRKFIIYGLTASVIGSVIGSILGAYLLPFILIKTLFANMALPDISLQFDWLVVILAVGCAIICSIGPALYVAYRELKEVPSLLLLPKPPAKGATILLERIPIIWRRLNFTHKVTFRNLFRYKQRMLMTIFGVAGSVALLFAGLGITASLGGVVEQQFGDIMHYDILMLHDSHLTLDEHNAIQNRLDSTEIQQFQSVYAKPLTESLPDVDDNQDITLIVAEANTLNQFVRLRNRQTQQPLTVSDSGIIISEPYSRLLGKDDFMMHINHHAYTVPVSGVAEFYTGHYAFMTPQAYQLFIGQLPPNNAFLINLIDSNNTPHIAAQLMSLNGVQAVAQNTDIIEFVDIMVHSLSTSMYILTAVSILLAIVILYNLTTINIAERIRELSTIKVLGFHNAEVTFYIFRETIILSFIGILLGLLGGNMLHQIMLQTVAPQNVMFNPEVTASVYIMPIGTVVTILTILGFIVNRTLKHIDLLDALKSIE